jgi:dihydropteroate synthase
MAQLGADIVLMHQRGERSEGTTEPLVSIST